MKNLSVRYTPLPEAAQESELDILADVYSFVIHVYENRKVATGGCADKLGGERDQPKGPSGSRGPSATDRRREGSDKPRERRR